MTTVKRNVKWVKVDGCWTRMSIMSMNNSLDTNTSASDKRINVLMIPGNCGNERFYERLGREFLPLISGKDREIYFYTVSHLNHVEVPKRLHHTGKYPPRRRISLEEQILHKKAFCKEYLPKDGKLFVISHSIGCYIALRLLPFLLQNKWDVGMVYAMYPVIERMEETQNGKILKPIGNFIVNHDTFVKISTSWLNVTPMFIKRFLTRVGVMSWSIPSCVLTASGEVFQTNVMRNIAFITLDELKQIRDFDHRLIQHESYITFYYGYNDAWTHKNAAEDMKRRVSRPNRVIFDELRCEHVIVFKDNEAIAKIMAKWVNSYMDPLIGIELSKILRRKRRRRSHRLTNFFL